ncbi:MAG: sigma-54-dependent transcriptional regulator [Eubacteriales bacterium]
MDINDKRVHLNRKEKLFNSLKHLTQAVDVTQKDWIGLDALSIGNSINIDRTNASKELNILHKENRIIKIKGKPVLYLERSVIESKLGFSLKKLLFENEDEFINAIYCNEKKEVEGEYPEIKEIEIAYNCESENTTSKSKCIIENNMFEGIIGWDKSLKSQVQLAKATILYPPNGLHALIIGPTGTGKSTFAEYMYKFAVEVNSLHKDAPFITFNCADYFDNPQLLISQIFGYAKGAFTGADKEKSGLIDAADKGVLFLDEIHRLPPEGQEMLFLLMDKGIYRRLGETDTSREAKILIIAATTENPRSVMLDTFLRRIPAIIDLPSLEKRTAEERLQMVYQFFWEQSSRIGAPIKATKEVLMAFMYYECPGNIGQLKSDIKLICAKAFLDYLSTGRKIMEVKLSHLSKSVQEGIIRLRDRRYALENHDLPVRNDITFNGKDKTFQKFIVENFSIINDIDYYENIINNWNKYSSEGFNEEEIRNKLKSDFDLYFQNSYKNDFEKSVESNKIVLEIVGTKILEAVESVLDTVKVTYDYDFSNKVVYGLALHLNNLSERMRTNKIISNPNNQNIQKEYPTEYKIAKIIKELLDEKLEIDIPEDETTFIAMLLYAISTTNIQRRIGVLVICHGNSVASSVCDVVNTLLGVDHAKAIDMPLDENVETILEKATETVRRLDRGKGVLIIVDMGSLINFSEMITESTGIITRCIDRANTLMVIEATRKSIISNMTIDKLVQEINSVFGDINYELKADKMDLSKNEEEYFKNNLINILHQTLTFLNPIKSYDTLLITLKEITKQLNKDINNDLFVKFLFHCSCMIERELKNDTLYYRNIDDLKKHRKRDLEIVKNNFKVVEETFNIDLCLEELAYVMEMLDTHFEIY